MESEKIIAEAVEPRRVGRPNKPIRLTIDRLLDSIEITSGKNFAMLIAEGYQDAIVSGNARLRLEYERMLLAKVVADKVDVSVSESEDTIEAKRVAFQEAITRLGAIAQGGSEIKEVNKLQ